MLLIFQLNHFLAFISDFGESKPDLHGPVIHILRKSRTQGLVNEKMLIPPLDSLRPFAEMNPWSVFQGRFKRLLAYKKETNQVIGTNTDGSSSATFIPTVCLPCTDCGHRQDASERCTGRNGYALLEPN